MKKSFLASILFVGFAAAALAQSPSPSPVAIPSPVGSVFKDMSKPLKARIADANAVLPTLTDPDLIEEAQYFADSLVLQDTNQPKSWPAIQTLAESLISSHGVFTNVIASNPTLSAQRQGNLFTLAVGKKDTLAFVKVDDRLAFLQGIFDGLPDDVSDAVVTELTYRYAAALRVKTTDLIGQGKFPEALANALQPQLLNSASQSVLTIQDVLKIKIITHAPDVLSWAKAVYVLGTFGQSSATSVQVANAFRSTNGMDVANQFIASQADDTIPNPLASVQFPDFLRTGPLPEPALAGANLVLRGDAKGALALARSAYDTAQSNAQLNSAGANVAAALRNFHGNLLRANAFVDSNKTPAPGQPKPAPFVFTELQ